MQWRLGRMAEVPPGDAWLALGERAVLARIRIEKRRREYRLGRWTAKRLLAACLGWPGTAPGEMAALAAVEIRAAEDGAPEVYLEGAPAALAISISHSGELALACVGPEGSWLGCDLEVIEARSPEFIADFFCPEEQALIAAAPAEEWPLLATLIWSAKESALKALRQGLREDTRSARVVLVGDPPDAGWGRLRVERAEGGCPGPAAFEGWWRVEDGAVLTVVAAGRERSPLTLPGLGV